MAWEHVHTIHDWFDGPRLGVADLGGKPHIFESKFDESTDDWPKWYLVREIESPLFKLILEDWEIWLRWRAAFDAGRTTMETHPVLPEDRERKAELRAAIGPQMSATAEKSRKMNAQFRGRYPDLEVEWSAL